METAPGNLAPPGLIEHTLSGISITTGAITQFIRAVRSSHADLSSVTHELADLRLVLELLRDDPDIPPALLNYLPTLLNACAHSLVCIDIALTQCSDSTQWASSPSRESISGQQGKLRVLRRALALVLEVVTLATSRVSEGDTDAVKNNVLAEAEEIRLLQHGFDSGAVCPPLDLYLDAIIESVGQYHVGLRKTSSQGGSSATDIGQTGLEQGLDALQLQGRHGSALGAQREFMKSDEKKDQVRLDTGSPCPSGSPLLSHYSPYPEPVSFERLQQMKRGHQPQSQSEHTPGLQYLQQLEYMEHMQSLQQLQQHAQPPPFVRPLFATSSAQSSPVTQQAPRSASIWSTFRPSWASSASPTSKSEAFGANGGSSESPILQPERWAEQLQTPGRHAPSPSISSIHTRNQSLSSAFHPPSTSSLRSGVSSHGHSSNLSQGSVVYPFGPGSPDLSVAGPSTPATSFLRPSTPRSVFSDQRPSTPQSVVSFSPASALPVLSPPKNQAEKSPLPSVGIPSVTKPALDITPAGQLSDKGKNQDVAYIDTSPTLNLLATRHTNKYLKIWSNSKNAVHSTIKVTTYVQPQPRSREYFVRSHAVLSENASLIGISTHFGLTLEIYNFSKGGSGAKKVQVIDDAHRWAASQLDAYHTNFAPLVVYRPKGDRIDRFFLARHPGAKKPFWEDTTNGIDLTRAELPFMPKFPELAFSANSPFLVAAAGPRPGEPPRPFPTILIAWKMTPVSDAKLQAASPVGTIRPTESESESHHRPYRVCVPEYPALQTALPTCLAARGSLAVSIWIPANHTETQLPGNKYKRKPMPAPERFVLSWDIEANTTRIFAIPNVQACISPDCRRVAYCDANAGRFVVLDAVTGDEIWRWPDAARSTGFSSYGQLESLHKVTVFEFSADGQTMMVGDANGAVGMYSVREVAKEPDVVYELQDTTADNRFSTASLYVPLVLEGQKVSELES
ncbi:hypothetical protein B0T16DRAFT_409641 [Cercophora newfieldiana]|uniref:Uncharacterized protein n=1 Tax=Cercophora newfieldiana TaxID=92897 RepID=A0AA39YD05_9PEZI|nr:hypothetical protein B0T16DRAFT_409641 [Cercophora newfieldiana]